MLFDEFSSLFFLRSYFCILDVEEEFKLEVIFLGEEVEFFKVKVEFFKVEVEFVKGKIEFFMV